jgi:hypothetical protein
MLAGLLATLIEGIEAKHNLTLPIVDLQLIEGRLKN